jgi:hypothetical protein
VSGHGSGRRAIVVFVDHADCPWLRLLARGFRHCFVLVRDGRDWLLCDPLKDRMLLARIAAPPDFDLAAHYAAQGHRVLAGVAGHEQGRRMPAVSPLTCVAVVKRVLGVRAPWILTPRQLHRHLMRQKRRATGFGIEPPVEIFLDTALM